MSKKIIALFLAVILSFSTLLLLTSCNDEVPEGEGFTVSFNTNGGTPVPSQRVREGGKATRPKNPTYEGNEFVGWYLDGVEYDFKTPVTKDITLEARWDGALPFYPLPPQ